MSVNVLRWDLLGNLVYVGGLFYSLNKLLLINFSLVWCSTIHHGVQLLLRINQRRNLFALVEMGIHYWNTRVREGPEPLPIPGYQYCILCALWFNGGWNTILSTQLIHRHHFLALIQWVFVCYRCNLNMVRTKHIDARAWHDQPIDQIGPVQLPVKPRWGQCCRSHNHSVARSRTAQPPGFHSQASQGCHTQPTGGPLMGGGRSYPSAKVQLVYSYSPSQQGKIFYGEIERKKDEREVQNKTFQHFFIPL